MKTRINDKRLLIVWVLLALLISCGAISLDTPKTERSEIPTNVSISLTPSPTPIEISPVLMMEQLIGTWEGQTTPGTYFYISIESDGTLKLARTLDNLNQGKTDTYQIWFENENLMFRIPVFCEGDGSYQAMIQPNGNLKFTTIEDPCDYRISRFDKSLPGAQEEYDVEFSQFVETIERAEVTFNGENCNYEGPEVIREGKVVFSLNKTTSEGNVGFNLYKHEDGYKWQDVLDYYGEPGSTGGWPEWYIDIEKSFVFSEPGAWEFPLDPGLYSVVVIATYDAGPVIFPCGPLNVRETPENE